MLVNLAVIRRTLTLAALVMISSLATTQVGWAMSNDCRAINQYWGDGRTIAGIFSYNDVSQNYDHLEPNETITYYAKTAVLSGGQSSLFAIVLGAGGADIYGSATQEVEASGSLTTFSSGQGLSIDVSVSVGTHVFVQISCEGLEPKITSISPGLADAAGTTTLTINGRRLGSDVKVGTYQATDALSMGSNQIVVRVPPQPVGTVDVVVTSSQGASPTSGTTKLTFAKKPDAPTIGAVSVTGSVASVPFSIPANNGTPILDYTVVASPGNLSATGTSSPLSIAGLAGGTSYTFTATARNAIGVGDASQPSSAVVIKAAQSISFPPPASMSFGGSAVLTATATSGLDVSFSTSTPAICQVSANGAVSALAAGDCIVQADQAGDTNYDPALPVTQTLSIAALPPGEPVLTNITAGDTKVTASFDAPAVTGGAPVTRYRVTASPGGAYAEGSGSPLTVEGLTNGTTYTFTATATNSAGTSDSSAPSGGAIPKGPQTISLSNPGIVHVDDSITILASASSGLTVTLSSADVSVCTIAPSGAVTLLSVGDCHIVGLQPGNATFLSAPQAMSSFMVLGVVPGAPTGVVATASPAEAMVSFEAPSFTGGSQLSLYSVIVSPGGRVVTGHTRPITVSGQSNGTSYSFVVAATNSTGAGAQSLPSNAVTPKALQTITLSDPGTVVFGATVVITASASSGLPVTLATISPSICAIDATGTVDLLAPGTCTITADQPGDIGLERAPQATVSFLVESATPGAPTNVVAIAGDGRAEVSFAPPVFAGDTPITLYNVVATPGAHGASGTQSPITVPGLANGTSYSFVVTATNASGQGAASTSSAAVTPQGAQTITVTNPGPQIIGAVLTLTGSASSGLQLSYTSQTPTICSATIGGTVTMLSAGQCVITAEQGGDSAYMPAVTVSASFMVSATQLIIAPASGALPNSMIGEPYLVQLSASGQSGALSWTLASGHLPEGLALGATTGLISGTLLDAALGIHSFTVEALDQSGGGITAASYSIAISARQIAAPERTIIVPSGAMPMPLDLTAGAAGGPFTGGQILSVEPAVAGTAAIVTTPAVLQFTPNPKYSGQAMVRYILTSALGTSEPFTVIYMLSADIAQVEAELTAMRDQFLSTRAGVWSGGISTQTLQSRFAALGADRPGSISIAPSGGNSLTMSYVATTQTSAAGAAESLVTGGGDDGGLRFWIDGTNTVHVRAGNSGERWGSAAILSLGADMLAAENLLFGVSLHADWMDEERGSEKNTGSGLSIGPYLSAELSENVYFDVSLIYGQSWNTTTDGLFAGTFGTTRWLGKAGLSGRLSLSEELTLQPNVAVFYLREDAEGYTASDRMGTVATIRPGLFEQLQASAGATLRYRLASDNGWIVEPHLGLDLGTALTSAIFSHSAALSGGIDLAGGAGWTLGLAGRLYANTSGLASASAQARLGLRY
ncbi:fibronectin type III domain-containing protein [Devosia sp.]|uniref:fibronectin type III domain-containing protein n=1 Tax=Devosia sp. TaxID=1871048 RepID=UPI001AC58446|nr:fibronectin type III domain-containing protein [Devosia sp.]MBN9334262.1 fibronectin type III domain-containing protein [Devosia sp.]